MLCLQCVFLLPIVLFAAERIERLLPARVTAEAFMLPGVTLCDLIRATPSSLFTDTAQPCSRMPPRMLPPPPETVGTKSSASTLLIQHLLKRLLQCTSATRSGAGRSQHTRRRHRKEAQPYRRERAGRHQHPNAAMCGPLQNCRLLAVRGSPHVTR